MPASDMSFCHLQRQPFQWVATLTGFLDALQALMPENAESAKISGMSKTCVRLFCFGSGGVILSTFPHEEQTKMKMIVSQHPALHLPA